MTNCNLSKRQQQVLDFIRAYSRTHGYPPSVREIGKVVGLKSSSTVHAHLNSLEAKGFITRRATIARSLVVMDKDKLVRRSRTSARSDESSSRTSARSDETYLVNDGANNANATEVGDRDGIIYPDDPDAPTAQDIIRSVVIVPLLGRVAAGEPILALDNIEDSFALPQKIVGDSGSFMLTIRGDSMIEAGIRDGDYVVVREQSTADNGDYVVAMIGDDATIKTFYREKDGIRLQPENSAMEPIYLRDVRIVGKVIALLRSL
ncbi:MAG: transcriptional repressor LexA [Coriobacteriales bacterium]|jgi:repressor LexA|nr:transcriptional repressor LexA [Coriobacteriales bacterium]